MEKEYCQRAKASILAFENSPVHWNSCLVFLIKRFAAHFTTKSVKGTSRTLLAIKKRFICSSKKRKFCVNLTLKLFLAVT